MGERSLDARDFGSQGLSLLGRNWSLGFLVLLLVVFSITGKNFLTLANLQTILYTSAISILLACAETFVIVSRGVDLSVGYVMGLSTIVCAGLMRNLHASQFGVGWPAFPAALVGVIAGMGASLVCGLASGLLISRYRVPPFIATLGVLGVVYGLTLHSSDGGFPIAFLPNGLTQIGNGYLYYYNPALKTWSFFVPPPGTLDTHIKDLVRVFPNSLVLVILAVLALWHLLKHTRFGRHTYAIGGNMDAAIRAGINTRRHLVWVYVLSAFLAGVAGIVNVFQTGTGNFVPMGSNLELFAIAAVIIGGASLNGGKGRIVGSLVGVFIIVVMANGLTLSGLPTFYRYIATGVILAASLVIDQVFPDLI